MTTAVVATLMLSLAAAANGMAFEAPALGGGWQPSKLVFNHETTKMTVVLVMKQSNLPELERLVLDVSTPDSENYGKHLTAGEVNALTRPSEATINTVSAWLRRNKLAEGSRSIQGGSAFRIHAAVRDIERAFQTTVGLVTDSSRVKPRAGDFTLPALLDGHIDAVFGMHGLPLPEGSGRVQIMPAAEIATVTPAVITTKYAVAGVTGAADPKNRQAVGEYQGQNFNPADNVLFFSAYLPSAPQGSSNIYKFVGTDNNSTSSIEPALDVEYIMGVSPGILTEYWGYQQSDFCLDLQQFTAKILDTADAPNVFSISYGWTGVLSQLGCQPAEVQAVEVNLQKLGLRGISMIIASQDNGAACDSATCYASWPSTSAYATSVGATRFINQDPTQPEQATDQFGSGGGFSTRFTRSNATAWQNTVVEKYLSTATNLPPASFFPKDGRAVPDISALGEGYATYVNGAVTSVGGTSAATPVIAGLVSLINQERLAKGKPLMGWLNPFLYKHPEAFTDVTVGNNRIGRGGQPLENGYDCAVGWDPVTGLGTPKFDQLLKAALA